MVYLLMKTFMMPLHGVLLGVLSEKGVGNKFKPIDFPDFTKGSWKTNKPHDHDIEMVVQQQV
jgi:hypothetical protein